MGTGVGAGDERELVLAEGTPVRAFDRELRWLRFADGLTERTFRLDYARRCMPQFRMNFWVGLAVQLPLSVRTVAFDGFGLDDPRFWLRLAIGVVPAVLGLRLARTPGFVQWAERYMVGYVLLIGGVLVLIFSSLPLGWTRLMSFLIAASIVPRLRFRAAIGVVAALVGWYVALAQSVAPAARADLRLGVVNLLGVAFLLLVGVYLLELSARRDFVLTRLLAQEREKSERLLLNVLPSVIADRLKEGAGSLADSFDDVTVLFADIVGFTPRSARFGAEETVELLNGVFTCFDELAGGHGLEKIKTVGDAYMVVGGVPTPRDDHAEAVVAMAVDMQAAITGFAWPDGEPLALRIGVSSGPVVAGVIGTSKFSYDLWGDTVNLASRMEHHGVPGAVQLSESTYAQVRDVHHGSPRRVTVKGKGRMRTYLLSLGAEHP